MKKCIYMHFFMTVPLCVIPYASMIMGNSQQAIRSAKEKILDVVGRTLDDALRIETLNGYSSLGDFSEAKERLSQFYSKGKGKSKA